MAKPEARISLHRFGDCGAIAILGTDGTAYLDPKAARQLARDAARLARSLERESFQRSEYRQTSIPAFEHSGNATSGLPRDDRGALK